MNTPSIHAYLEKLKCREEEPPKIPNHGQWETFSTEIQFECSHGVWPIGVDGSLCYTTSEERAQWIAKQMTLAAETPKLRAIVECLLEAVEETWERGEMGYIIGDGKPAECGECGEKASRVSEAVIHQPDCFQGKIEDALTRVGQMVESLAG